MNARRFQPVVRRFPGLARAFTLLELLVVITIIGILAALSVPAIKNLGKSNIRVSATRQMLDDVARARQLAISQHTTVYMVFVSPNFWVVNGNLNWLNNLDFYQRSALSNLLEKQGAGYTFVTLRSIGDQPGRGQSRYIGEWRTLPEGAFIATNKFFFNNYYPIYNFFPGAPYYAGYNSYWIPDPVANKVYPINSFVTNAVPFPTETNAPILLPCIAFNYLGQLTVDGINLAPQDEYIPLAQGNVLYALDVNKQPIISAADFTEIPTGNSTNSMFHIIHIDRLTGRPSLLEQKLP